MAHETKNLLFFFVPFFIDLVQLNSILKVERKSFFVPTTLEGLLGRISKQTAENEKKDDKTEPNNRDENGILKSALYNTTNKKEKRIRKYRMEKAIEK